MRDRAVAVHRDGDYSDDELRAIAASLAGADAAKVCHVVAAVSVHTGDGGHELMVLTTITDNRKAVADLFRHAADHVYGGCYACHLRNRRNHRDATP